MCLVQQNDQNKDNECDQPETESEPMECSKHMLKTLAFQNM